MALDFPNSPTIGQTFPVSGATNIPIWQWDGTAWQATGPLGFQTGVIPQNSQSANYTTVLADAGKFIYHPASDANARTFTIPANATVSYTIGTTISFINLSTNALTIAITTDTMYLSPGGTTGSRTLAQYGRADALKVDTAIWVIRGSGLT